MKAADMRRVLGEMPDFKYEKTKVEKKPLQSRTQSYFYSSIPL